MCRWFRQRFAIIKYKLLVGASVGSRMPLAYFSESVILSPSLSFFPFKDSLRLRWRWLHIQLFSNNFVYMLFFATLDFLCRHCRRVVVVIVRCSFFFRVSSAFATRSEVKTQTFGVVNNKRCRIQTSSNQMEWLNAWTATFFVLVFELGHFITYSSCYAL